jgi:FdhD protein
LAAGFLLTEGIVRQLEDIVQVAYCRQGEAAQLENTVNAFLSPAVQFDLERLSRHVFVSSSCGLCGKASIEAVQLQFPPIPDGFRVKAEMLIALPERLRAAQDVFERTGGLHAAAIFDREGRLIVLREDVGRHNAVDKVIGHGLLAGSVPFHQHVLLVSGRASFEIMQKALAAGFPVVAAISAPSSLAVEAARENGQTLIGFLRGETMNIYSHPERLLMEDRADR